MVPHVTDAIQEWIIGVGNIPSDRSGSQPDICLVELGGTVGDIESAVYTEALQQLQFRVGRENFLMAHVGFLPTIGSEQKTKPCQHGVKLLREAGIKPDLILCRSEKPIEEATRKKLSLFCQVQPEFVISMHDVSDTFRVPLLFHEQRVGEHICHHFGLPVTTEATAVLPIGLFTLRVGARSTQLGDWKFVADRADLCLFKVTIALVGKYNALEDAYASVIKALKHAAIEAGLDLHISWVESSDLEPAAEANSPDTYDAAWAAMRAAEGVLVPGGFGDRGIEGKILAANFCRTSGKPYFGICVGLQTCVIEFARNVLKLEDANSTEFDESSPHPVVIFMPESSMTTMGGTMRLGSRATIIRDPNSLACKLYGGNHSVSERHRHRYEVNASFVPAMEAQGLIFSGQDRENATR